MEKRPEMSLAEVRAGVLDTINAYGIYYDAGDFKSFIELFTDDARIDIAPAPDGMDIPLFGRGQIARAYKDRFYEVRATGGRRRHVSASTVFDDIKPDRCETRTVLLSFNIAADRTMLPVASGVYRDVLRRVGDGWRFAERRLSLD